MSVVKNKKFEPILWVADQEYHIQEINHDRLFLVDGRKLHWNRFFNSETEFRSFLKKFEKFKTNKPENFMKAFHTLLTKYDTSIDVDDDRVLKFNIAGDVTEVKAVNPINAERILDIISLRGKLHV